MRYLALATDYDGTLATDGHVSQPSIDALDRLRASGRRLILVTGRELGDLQAVFARLDLFDRVVAENGAVLYRPTSRDRKVLAERPPEAFVTALREKHVQPLKVGDAVVATHRAADSAVLEVIAAMGLELQIIFNRDSAMILPSGVNKATGLSAALEELELSPHNTIGIGDAENDHAFLALCEFGVAVANAIPLLKERADLVSAAEAGDGVVEIVHRLLATDLAEIADGLRRHDLRLGQRVDGSEFRLPAYGLNLLIMGPSEGGKSTLSTAFIERLAEQRYQFCIVDPEGEYEGVGTATSLGDRHHPPQPMDVLGLLAHPNQSVAVNLLAIKPEDRPAFVVTLLAQLQELRARTGRPHWIVVDDAHRLLPVTHRERSIEILPGVINLALMSASPKRLADSALAHVDLVIVAGDRADRSLEIFSRVLRPGKPPASIALEPGQAAAYGRWTDGATIAFRVVDPRVERHLGWDAGTGQPPKVAR